MKKLIVASALAVTMLTGLATSPKVQASSTAKSAKVTFKQYKKTKTYKNGLKADFSYNLPKLKGNSAAVKKINKELLGYYKAANTNASKELFAFASDSAKGRNLPIAFIIKNCTYFDITKISVSYNKNNIISFKVYRNAWSGYYVGNKERVYSQIIAGWTYSLKSGKRLNITDVAKGDKASVQKKLSAGVTKYFGIKKGETITVHYFLKNGKVYLYPDLSKLNQKYTYAHRNPPVYYNSYFTVESRYK
ncbi:hypothetical protein lacNasYZ03_00220 [Lactobacillus nasalidis]|uniref:Uncharacterized protein n=1 Tax=Lactobacillus nasalidis TaxID=2797258 RepID=A0ABQ3W273_9LACO|nr:hypothetical protein [Lactobacillus nasalidis]GHV98508.1 hypothetical protein lacNasYZ01_16900 [Lactobacillus nasalidis]GHW00003.1 hypothetical protein lacNasYZ02_14320 [Lactobacillus nasalidis]GHW00335.1 hypothetical protein lacNasYZ03_00220 [Lactobacillus nasalidis]